MEPATISQRLSTLKRWRSWLFHHPEWTDEGWDQPSIPCFAAFCKQVAAGGPTAAAGCLASLQWCNDALGTQLPLDDYYIADYAKPRQGHVEQPAVVLEPWQLVNLYKLATVFPDAVVRFRAKLILFVAVACIRHRHLVRAVNLVQDGAMFDVHVSKQGKRRVKREQTGLRCDNAG